MKRTDRPRTSQLLISLSPAISKYLVGLLFDSLCKCNTRTYYWSKQSNTNTVHNFILTRILSNMCDVHCSNIYVVKRQRDYNTIYAFNNNIHRFIVNVSNFNDPYKLQGIIVRYAARSLITTITLVSLSTAYASFHQFLAGSS